ncbi:MAG: hypothetical protein AABY22_26850 [Nanoarchaeota archaeon]
MTKPTLQELLAYKFYLEAKTQKMSINDLLHIIELMKGHAFNSQLGEKVKP